MTIELDDASYDICRYLDWPLETGVWNGRQVSWAEAPALYDEIQTRVFELLLQNTDEGLAATSLNRSS